jgi:hypothetical protein
LEKLENNCVIDYTISGLCVLATFLLAGIANIWRENTPTIYTLPKPAAILLAGPSEIFIADSCVAAGGLKIQK